MKSLLKKTMLAASVVAMSAGALADNHAEADMDKTFYEFKDEAQTELLPPSAEEYREWVYVGTPFTPNELNNGAAPFPEFHSVYIDPVSFAHWKETGEFREGTMIMKELISVGSKSAVSGNGYFMGEFIGLEATIKSAELYPDEPGNWAYFSWSTPDHQVGVLNETATAYPAAACAACHTAAAADDMVFTQYYPVLPASKGGYDK